SVGDVFLCINLPISGSKCSIGDQITWIGWRISFDSWTVELPDEKIHRILDQITSLCPQKRIKIKDLESIIGRLLWLTGLWRLLRPLLQPLYTALRDIPCTIVAVSPQLWTQVSRWEYCNLFPGDSDHPLRCLSPPSISALQSWAAILSSTPCVFNIKQAPLLHLVAEADAFADEVKQFFPSLEGSLQPHICALELLAQYCLLWMASEMVPRARHQLTIPMRSDNSGAELASVKGMSSVKILGEVLLAFLDFQRRNGLHASVEHIPGYRNDLADELSRLRDAVSPLTEKDRLHSPLHFLLRSAGRVCRPDAAKWPKPWR
ncbi:unnamed protein product, partial [Symbiodinium sp. CCMP2456]